jgi:hypothetical protein
MAGRGSKPGERRGGRQKGTPNKITKALKDMVLSALDKAGGEEYLLQQAKTNPNAFMTLIGKVLPMQVSGPGGGPIRTTFEATKLSTGALREILAAAQGNEEQES